MVEKLEEMVLEEWGYDELVLLVEATNFQVGTQMNATGRKDLKRQHIHSLSY